MEAEPVQGQGILNLLLHLSQKERRVLLIRTPGHRCVVADVVHPYLKTALNQGENSV